MMMRASHERQTMAAPDAGLVPSPEIPGTRGFRDRTFRARYGPWAVVTGASDGIGREFAERAAAEGLNVVLVARRGELLAQLGAALESTHRIRASVIAVDLATAEGVSELTRRTAEIDVGLLVASAGFGTAGRFIEGDLDEELAMIDVNCRAVAALTHHYGSRFARRGRGGIVLLSSLVAFQGVPRAANYAATKAYVQSLAEGIGIELAPFGVDVVACAPGPVESGFGTRARMRMGFALKPESVAQATLEALGRRRTIRPGWLSKVLEWSLVLLPRWGRVRMMGAVMGGMTKHLT